MPKRRAPLTIRNGLAWRGGRPRWEPSPASRKAAIKGLDLKRPDGTWMDRGEAIGAADARATWAAAIRAALADGPRGAEAATDLRTVLDSLEPARGPQGLARRAAVADLIERARGVLGEIAPSLRPPVRRERTVARLVEAYFADDAVAIAASTRRAYRTQSARFVARFGETRVADVTRGQLRAWYRELLAAEISVANANQCLGAASAFLAWAADREPPWIEATPAKRLGLETAPGRLVFWTVEDEQAFTAWCDANGWADLADGIVGGLWTGARIGDLCAANLSDLAGKTWRFVPAKTAKRRQEALPAIMEPLKARVARRKAQLVTAIDGAFLFDPRTGRRHDAGSFGRRFAEAKSRFVRAGLAPDGFAAKHVQDTRDTCITRLWEAGVRSGRMYAWTGHSQASIDAILREHYLVLREQGSLAMADKLAGWARAEGMDL